jgi:glycosyltransferase involved in cell wall biosynthesis
MVTEAAASLSIIVPVYDEEQNLPTVAEKLLSVLQTIGRDYEIIFVNDGSRDRSAAVLDELAATDEHIKVVHFKRNFGQTSAMMAGLDYSSGEVIIPIDADLQNDPIDIPRLLERLDEGFDLVSGWRKDRKDDTLRRNLPSWVANWIISKISGVKLHDYGCTLKAYRRSIVEDIRLYGEMHRFLPVYASWSGARTTELPVQLKRIVKVPLDLLVVKFLGDYSQKPIYVFGGFGLFSHALALLTFVVMVYYKYWGGKSFIETPLPVLAALLILMGFISMLMGLIAELVVRTYHESQDKSTYSVKTTVNFPQDDR